MMHLLCKYFLPGEKHFYFLRKFKINCNGLQLNPKQCNYCKSEADDSFNFNSMPFVLEVVVREVLNVYSDINDPEKI